jgi:hypothetical protein
MQYGATCSGNVKYAVWSNMFWEYEIIEEVYFEGIFRNKSVGHFTYL